MHTAIIPIPAIFTHMPLKRKAINARVRIVMDKALITIAVQIFPNYVVAHQPSNNRSKCCPIDSCYKAPTCRSTYKESNCSKSGYALIFCHATAHQGHVFNNEFSHITPLLNLKIFGKISR